eukprot:s5825_g5.t1
MDRLSQAVPVLHPKALGEDCLERWSRTSSIVTETEEMMAKLNRASREKTCLRKFCEAELKCQITDNDTIAIMHKKGIMAILNTTEPQASDYMGFGRHSQRTYAEVLHLDAQYTDWAIAKTSRSESCLCLQRFARWAEKIKKDKNARVPLVHRPKSRVKADSGKTTMMYSLASSSGTPAPPTPDPRDELLMPVVNSFKDLQEEMASMCVERSRKVTSAKE